MIARFVSRWLCVLGSLRTKTLSPVSFASVGNVVISDEAIAALANAITQNKSRNVQNGFFMGRNASLSSPLVPQRSPVCLVPDLSPFPKTFAGNLECRQCRCFIAADTKKTACSSPFVGAHPFSKFIRKLFQKKQGFSRIPHLLKTLRRIQIKSDIRPVQIVEISSSSSLRAES